ncbi:unnamed protein product [Paramecium sonneborni]|uniref:Uncharacterized protein n=1 Tax=Paramecium sonneborni TaxID=65129 RepID=A0A8S1RSB4_9CILI|nr:unnamed protein product [Paramecium sonneborni]
MNVVKLPRSKHYEICQRCVLILIITLIGSMMTKLKVGSAQIGIRLNYVSYGVMKRTSE